MSSSEEVETYKVWHYGYHPRTLPCMADQPNCDYLDALWHANDLGMVYSGILWIIVGVVLLVLTVLRRTWVSRSANPLAAIASGQQQEKEATAADASTAGEPLSPSPSPSPTHGSRHRRALASAARARLLPDSVRFVFGRTTRLQVLILTSLVVYLTVFSFIGMEYALWVSPVADHPGVVKKQNTMGIWSNRIGILAYAITPFAVLLGSRESLLSLLTGIPYQAFNFLHRWVGYIILLQSILHALAWTIICLGLYGPQPSYAINWVTKEYMIWGICAQFLLIFMYVGSTPWCIRLTGFEFFRKSHYVLAMVYIGTCWGHWEFLGDWMLCALLLWFFDRIARLVRTLLLHHQRAPGGGDWGFYPARAAMAVFPEPEAGGGDVVRLDFPFAQRPWHVGQHFYLCFPDSSVWQSHPFTPLSLPAVRDGVVTHSYVFRAKRGETRKLAELAARRLASSGGATAADAVAAAVPTTPVILQGPYGEKSTEGLTPRVNILAVAGGTGITYVLPVLLESIATPSAGPRPTRAIQLIWIVRHAADAAWIQPELDLLAAAAATHNVTITILATRDRASPASDADDAKLDKSAPSPAASDVDARRGWDVRRVGSGAAHPDVGALVGAFVEQTVSGPSVVYASGPAGMISDLRTAVAALNSGKKVLAGDERFDVDLKEDNRLEL